MRIRKLVSKLSLLLICLLLTGCGGSIKEKQEIKKEAINYLKQKYNIDQKDIKIKNNAFYGKSKLCIDSCGYNRMKIKYNNKIYNIYYNIDNNSFSDDIQYETILQDITNEFYKKYDKPVDIEIKLRKDNNEYYDETNLKNVVEDLSINAYFVDKKDYNEAKTNSFLKEFYGEYNGTIKLIFFKENEDYTKYNNYKSEYQMLNIDFYSYADRYIDFIQIIDKSEMKKSISNKVKLGNGFIAAWWDLPNEIKMEKIAPFDLNEISNYSKALYSIDSDFYKLSSNQIDMSKIAFKVMREDDTITEKRMVATMAVNNSGNVLYALVDAVQNDRLYFTKAYGYKEVDFVILKK